MRRFIIPEDKNVLSWSCGSYLEIVGDSNIKLGEQVEVYFLGGVGLYGVTEINHKLGRNELVLGERITPAALREMEHSQDFTTRLVLESVVVPCGCG